jgi:glyoxylate reductase
VSERRPRILAIRKLPDAVEARLARDYDAVLNADDHTRSPEEILEQAQGVDGIVTSAIDRLSGDLIRRLPASVRIIATFSVGYDHVDIAAAKERGMVVTNTPDVLTDATADIALLLLLAASRRAFEAQSTLRAGRWIGWRPTQFMGIGHQP